MTNRVSNSTHLSVGQPSQALAKKNISQKKNKRNKITSKETDTVLSPSAESDKKKQKWKKLATRFIKQIDIKKNNIKPIKSMKSKVAKIFINKLYLNKNVKKTSKVSPNNSSVEQRLKNIFSSYPVTSEGISTAIHELKKHRGNLSNKQLQKYQELQKKNPLIEEQINTYIEMLEKKNENIPTFANLLKIQKNRIIAVKEHISELQKQNTQTKQLDFLKSLMNKYQDKIEQKLSDTKRCSQPPLDGDKKRIAEFYTGIEKLSKKIGLKISVDDLRKTENRLLERKEMSPIHKEINIYDNDIHYELEQTSTPACSLQWDSEQQSNNKERGKYDIFQNDYNGCIVTSQSNQNTTHANNLFVSTLSTKNKDKGSNRQNIFQTVRSGVISAYGLEAGSIERKRAAINKAKEVIIASLTTKPELLDTAVTGNVVDFTLVSTSLLTPDSVRKHLGLQAETDMLEDQIAAFNELQRDQPLELQIKSSNGQPKIIRINVKIIPFNISVNDFAVRPYVNNVAGWPISDAINDPSMELLVGLDKSADTVGGLAGDFLVQNPNHPQKQIIEDLAKQVKEIYLQKAHHTNQGGSHKLSSRVALLAHYLGFGCAVNCKSGKDRTGVSVAITETLAQETLINNEVPDWRTVTPTAQKFVQEFALQGASHDIQTLNTGAPGFKTQKYVLKKYMPDAQAQDAILSLCDIVSH